MFQKPNLTGKTDRENLEILETWANNLIDDLNYSMNHIDNQNVVPGLKMISESELREAMNKQYEELRKLIIERTKGE